MEMYKYIISDKGEIVVEPDLLTWARWFEKNRTVKCRVGWTEVGDYIVSTVFLALDYNFGFSGEKEPILFETMVFEKNETEVEMFGKKKMVKKSLDADGMMDRYCTLAEAEKGHLEICEKVELYQQKNKQTHATPPLRKKLEGTDNAG